MACIVQSKDVKVLLGVFLKVRHKSDYKTQNTTSINMTIFKLKCKLKENS